jgi:tRNA A-37 threonylcarbamoyl transferase component Bud32
MITTTGAAVPENPPSTNTASSPASPDDNSGLVIALVVVAVVVCLLLVLVLLFVARRRKYQRAASVQEYSSSVENAYLSLEHNSGDSSEVSAYAKFSPSVPASASGAGPYMSIDSVKDAGLAEAVSLDDPADLTRGKELGRGEYGVVYKGRYRGRDVAIKHMAGQYGEEQLSEFLAEADLMRKIKAHPNVVEFVGLVSVADAKSPALVVGLCNGQDLEHVLEEEGPPADPIPILLDIARGMRHLAAASIVHRDLAARNVLMDNGVARIGDFGMSRLSNREEGNVTQTTTGPLRWMAPEALSERRYSEKSDGGDYVGVFFSCFVVAC